MRCFTVSDRYLIVTVYGKLTVRDLQSNKLIKTLSHDAYPGIGLYVVNNKIIFINWNCTIKIWNLNDIKLFKEFKLSEYELYMEDVYSIVFDSKRLTVFTMDDDVVIYDFTENLRKIYLKHL